MMNIKTLMLGWEFPPFISGGLGTACHGLTKAMSRRGMEVTFVMPGQRPLHFHAGSQEAAETLRRELPNVRIHAIPSNLSAYGRYGPAPARPVTAAVEAELVEDPLEGPAPYGPSLEREVVRYARRVMKVAQREEFDVIHAHDWMTFPAGIALATHTGKPLIVQVHSTEFDRSGEHVNQFVYDIERQGMHAATRVITVSNYTRSIVVNRYAVPPEKVEVVYNGVDLEGSPVTSQQSPGKTSLGLSEDDFVVVCVANFTSKTKGHEELVEALRKLKDKAGEGFAKIKILLVGDGPLRARVNLQVVGHGLQDNVLFAGKRSDVREILQACDMCVLSSLSEGLSNALLEYMASGKPVVATAVGGNLEVIQDGRNGILVPAGNSAALAEGIAKVWGDKELALRLGAAARKTVEEKFDLTRQIEELQGTLETTYKKATT